MLPTIQNILLNSNNIVTFFALSTVEKLSDRWAWYLSRGSGIFAAILAVILIISGIGLLSGLTFKLFEPLKAWAIHRAMGIALLFSLLIHIFVLLFDKYASLTLLDLLVPFASDFNSIRILGFEVGSFYLALGIISFYVLIAIVLTSIFMIQNKSRLWHLVHFLSYLVMIFIFMHGLFLGTELKSIAGKILWFTGAFVVLIFTIRRLALAGTTKIDK